MFQPLRFDRKLVFPVGMLARSDKAIARIRGIGQALAKLAGVVQGTSNHK
jgi:hypothetical protein